ncbi:DUF4355 domain-containing protein [Clostridium sp.]|uniref:DUF4355 domain-containing protein n=1 Tax=Clostridium sp. TaxID=1506 RepID=UPI003216AAD5
MLKKDLLKLIESIEDEGSIDEVLSQSDFAKSLVTSGLTLDAFKGKLTEPEFKSFVDSVKDTHFNTALDTWKTNNLQKLIDAELIKKNPSLTPEQLKIEELTKQFEEEKIQRQLSEQKSRLKDEMREQNVDPRIIDLLINKDADVTKANLQLYVEANKNYIQKEVENRLKDGQYTPPGSEADKAKQAEVDVMKAFGL